MTDKHHGPSHGNSHHESPRYPPQTKEVINITENIIIVEGEHYHRGGSPELKIIGELVQVLDRLTRPDKRTNLVLSGISNKFLTIKNSIIMAISLNVNEFVTSTLGLVDHATQTPITDASFSNQSYVSDNDSVATVDTSGKVTSVSAGTTNITFRSDVSYTGLDGQPKTESGKTLVVAVTVNGTSQSTDLTVSFSAPQPV